MSLVKCKFVSGLRASEVLAQVDDALGRHHVIRVEKDFLTSKPPYYYLPIGIINEDSTKDLVLIEFSHEPETGMNRIWVKQDQLDEPIGAIK